MAATPYSAAVFLDRDGVINQPVIIDNKPYPPKSLQEFVLIPGVSEALAALKKAGFFLSVVTNQPDVGRGTIDKSAVESIHAHMRKVLPLDDIRVCYDDGRQVNSNNRKPNPGMILDAAREFSLDLNRSFMIGDRWRDVEAGLNAGCKTIFIDYHYDEALPRPPDYVVGSLQEAATLILNLIEIP
jgi:D-glycero-D-manno-heptose 1,7-bisphosphate phosphatase